MAVLGRFWTVSGPFLGRFWTRLVRLIYCTFSKLRESGPLFGERHTMKLLYGTHEVVRLRTTRSVAYLFSLAPESVAVFADFEKMQLWSATNLVQKRPLFWPVNENLWPFSWWRRPCCGRKCTGILSFCKAGYRDAVWPFVLTALPPLAHVPQMPRQSNRRGPTALVRAIFIVKADTAEGTDGYVHRSRS